MPTSTAHEATTDRLIASRPFGRWSTRRRVISVAVVVVVCAGGALFAWRASLSPLRLWTDASQCAADPNGNVGSLFGLAISRDLSGVSQIHILSIESPSASGATAPRYWLVPVTDGSGGTGSASTALPPPHWNQRIPAIGSTFQADEPANLLVELRPHLGHAVLNEVRVTYRTPDGLIHVAAGDADMEVDTTGKCNRSTGRL